MEIKQIVLTVSVEQKFLRMTVAKNSWQWQPIRSYFAYFQFVWPLAVQSNFVPLLLQNPQLRRLHPMLFRISHKAFVVEFHYKLHVGIQIPSQMESNNQHKKEWIQRKKNFVRCHKNTYYKVLQSVPSNDPRWMDIGNRNFGLVYTEKTHESNHPAYTLYHLQSWWIFRRQRYAWYRSFCRTRWKHLLELSSQHLSHITKLFVRESIREQFSLERFWWFI